MTSSEIPSITLESVSDRNQIIIPFVINHSKGKTDAQALIDSGSYTDMIDEKFVVKHKLEAKELGKKIKLVNMDHSTNGFVTHYVNVTIEAPGFASTERFFIANLGKDELVLGMTWL